MNNDTDKRRTSSIQLLTYKEKFQIWKKWLKIGIILSWTPMVIFLFAFHTVPALTIIAPNPNSSLVEFKYNNVKRMYYMMAMLKDSLLVAVLLVIYFAMILQVKVCCI